MCRQADKSRDQLRKSSYGKVCSDAMDLPGWVLEILSVLVVVQVLGSRSASATAQDCGRCRLPRWLPA
jgi:hypothetical protein